MQEGCARIGAILLAVIKLGNILLAMVRKLIRKWDLEIMVVSLIEIERTVLHLMEVLVIHL